MAKLVKNGAIASDGSNEIHLPKITGTAQEGGGQNCLYTVQSTTEVESGVSLQLQYSLDGDNWANIADGILENSTPTQGVNVVLSSKSYIRVDPDSLSTYTGTVIIL